MNSITNRNAIEQLSYQEAAIWGFCSAFTALSLYGAVRLVANRFDVKSFHPYLDGAIGSMVTRIAYRLCGRLCFERSIEIAELGSLLSKDLWIHGALGSTAVLVHKLVVDRYFDRQHTLATGLITGLVMGLCAQKALQLPL